MLTLMNTTYMRAFCLALLVLLATAGGGQRAAARSAKDQIDAQSLAQSLSKPLAEAGYEFRAEAWTCTLKPEIGRAVRVQLFKGLDYRFCLAAAGEPTPKLAAVLLDFDGKPLGKATSAANGRGVIIAAQPKKTGVYAIAIRQLDGTSDVTCALVTGWK